MVNKVLSKVVDTLGSAAGYVVILFGLYTYLLHDLTRNTWIRGKKK
jgi:hypothetical protein